MGRPSKVANDTRGQLNTKKLMLWESELNPHTACSDAIKINNVLCTGRVRSKTPTNALIFIVYRAVHEWHTIRLAITNNLYFYTLTSAHSYCYCVRVFFPIVLDIKFVGRSSRGHTGGRSHGISPPPSFCGACLNFSREKDSAIFLSLVDREVEFCVLTILIVLHLLGVFIFIFSATKNPSYRDSSSRSKVSVGCEVTNWATGATDIVCSVISYY